MKKVQIGLTLAALVLASAGVFATISTPPAIDQRIDSNGDNVCDQPVSSQCNQTTGQNCRYNDNGTMKTVHDINANCQLLFKP